MNYQLVFIFLLFFNSASFINAQIIDIPDANFKQALIDNDVDTNGDGVIQISEAESTTSLYMEDRNISELNGIESFINLKTLDANVNNLSELDLTHNIKLERVYVNLNNLNSIDVTGIISLEYLYVSFNNLSQIDLDSNINLKRIDLSVNNLNELDLSKNVSIERISVSDNNLAELDLTKNLKLEELEADKNSINNIDLSKNIALKEIDLENNDLTNIDFTNNVRLEVIQIEENTIREIDLSQNQALKRLIISNNELSELDIRKNINLEQLYAASNSISNIDIGNNLLLESLVLGATDIVNLDISKNLNLEALVISQTEISELDLSKNIKLRGLYIMDCKFKEIDLTHNLDLEIFWCFENELTQLDLSNNIALYQLWCYDNPLTFLNIKNSSQEYEIKIEGCLQLTNICCDREDLDLVQESILLEGYNCEFNTYCSVDPGGINYEVYGSFYFDFNQNGCQDSFSLPYPKFLVSDSIGEGLFFGNEMGDYGIMLPEGKYEVSPVIENLEIFNISPPSLEFDLEIDSDIIVQDFCLVPEELVQDLEITIIPIDQARPGFETEYKIIYENKGTTVVSGNVKLYYESEFMEYLASEPIEDKVNSYFISWDYEDLLPFEQRSIIVTMELNRPTDNPALNGGDVLAFKAVIDPIDLEKQAPDNTACLDQEVVNSYDPNDKRCLEGSSVLEEMIGEYMHYMIRFENTGSADAVNVIVTDSLDTDKFDVASLEIVEASHSAKVQVIQDQVAEFYFEDIFLPFGDDNNDGYVVFKIRTLPTLLLGDSFENTAQIYFDFNFPIITNTTNTSIDMLSTISTSFENDLGISVYPNPVSDILNIDIPTGADYNLYLYNLQGGLLEFWNKNLELDLSSIPRGVYWLELKDLSTGKTTTQRIILQ
jgi:hypothetical protein